MLALEFKIVKYRRPARVRFKKGVNLVIYYSRFPFFCFLKGRPIATGMFYEKKGLKKFAKFTEKHLSLFLIKLQVLG